MRPDNSRPLTGSDCRWMHTGLLSGGLNYSKCIAPWQASRWTTATVSSQSSGQFRWICLFRFGMTKTCKLTKTHKPEYKPKH